MFFDPEPFKKRALVCFIPPLQGEDEESTWEEVKHLALVYKRNLDADRQKQPVVTAQYRIQWSKEIRHISVIYKHDLDANRQNQTVATFHCWIELSAGRTEDVVDPAPRRRGRPRDQAGARLVHDLRNMLVKLGRRHGATHEDRTRYDSALEDLAEVVHRMVGEPPKEGWRDKAEMANSSMETSRRRRVLLWWLNLNHSPGAHPRSLTLEEARMWDTICGPTLWDSSSRSATSPLGEGPEKDEGDDR